MGWQDIPNFDNKTCALNLNKSKKFLGKLIHLKSLKKIIITGSYLEYLNKKEIINENQKLDKINFMLKSKIDLQVFSKKLCFINKKNFFG